MHYNVVTSLVGLRGEVVLWLFFLAVLIMFGIFSAILLWHWKLYSTGKYTALGMMTLYLGVSAGFIVVMFIALMWETFL